MKVVFFEYSHVKISLSCMVATIRQSEIHDISGKQISNYT